jgi:hypothetical protein
MEAGKGMFVVREPCISRRVPHGEGTDHAARITFVIDAQNPEYGLNFIGE